jgi:hypothetical protein
MDPNRPEKQHTKQMGQETNLGRHDQRAAKKRDNANRKEQEREEVPFDEGPITYREDERDPNRRNVSRDEKSEQSEQFDSEGRSPNRREPDPDEDT